MAKPPSEPGCPVSQTPGCRSVHLLPWYHSERYGKPARRQAYPPFGTAVGSSLTIIQGTPIRSICALASSGSGRWASTY